MTESEQVTVLNPAALENLREMIGGDDAFLVELIDTFLADAPQMLSDMHQALEGRDVVVLHRAAHSLKSNSADFGATVLSDLCRELEELSKAGMLTGVAGLTGQVDAEYARAKAALEAMRKDLQGRRPA